MIHVLAFLISVFFIQNCNSQTVATFEVNEMEFVKPSINNIINFLELDFDEWESVMQRLKYKKVSKPNELVIYSKGKIGYITQAISKTNHVVFIEWLDFEDQYNTLKLIKQELKDYFAYRSNDMDFYHYKGYIIGISYYSDEQYRTESILIKKE